MLNAEFLMPAHGGGGVESASAQVLYVTDPICSHCWAMEPAWRRFLYHYGEHVHAGHLYGGLLPQWDGFADVGAGIRAPADIPPHWDEVVERYGQPIDGSVWYTDPLDSSFPSSMAMHVVRSLAPELEEAYLRRIRQALFLEARNIARLDVLTACASDLGIDAGAFRQAWESGVGARGFAGDLQRLRELPVRGFPTLIVSGGEEVQPRVMRGTQPFSRLERGLAAMLGELPPRRTLDVDEVLAAYGSGTTREFAEVLEVDEPVAEELLRAAGATARPLAGSHLWQR